MGLAARAGVDVTAWPPRDWRAMLALAATVIGVGILSGLAYWLVWIIWHGGWQVETEKQRLDILGKGLFGTLGIIMIAVGQLGMAISKRDMKASILGAHVDMSGGDGGDSPPSASVTTTTEVRP